MKANPDFPRATDLIKELADHARSDDQLNGFRRLTGPPETPEERATAREEFVKLLDAQKIRFVCVGCGDDAAIDDTVGHCECGGFVCVACQRVEEDGVCNHEPPGFLPPADDEEDEGS